MVKNLPVGVFILMGNFNKGPSFKLIGLRKRYNVDLLTILYSNKVLSLVSSCPSR